MMLIFSSYSISIFLLLFAFLLYYFHLQYFGDGADSLIFILSLSFSRYLFSILIYPYSWRVTIDKKDKNKC